MPHPFTAEALFEIIDLLCDFNWKQKAREKRISNILGGHSIIYSDGRKMGNTVVIHIPEVKNRFLDLVKDIYGGMDPDIAASGFISQRWRIAAKIINLGKQRGISMADWNNAVLRKVLSPVG